VVRQLRILVSQFRVLRTGTRSEIRPDNMYLQAKKATARSSTFHFARTSQNKKSFHFPTATQKNSEIID
jgi:hypothetical protein